MSSPGSGSYHTKRILKMNRKRRNDVKIREDNRNLQDLEEKTPVKQQNRILDDQQTVKKTLPTPNLKEERPPLDLYHSSNPYVLGQINSVYYHNGRFYDLLKLKKQSFQTKKQVKCNCLKSKCQAKYCDCFAKGVGCSPLCGCLECKNKISTSQQDFQPTDRFCKCSKSGCVKKYCQCFQRGDACSSKCRCSNCQNASGQ